MRSLMLGEAPRSPELRRQFRFTGNIGSDRGGFVAPVNTLQRLCAVAAQNSHVAAECLSGFKFRAKDRERNREFVVAAGAGELDVVADIVDAIDMDRAPGRAERNRLF